MCVDRSNVSQDDLDRFKALLETLPEGSALRDFLEPMHDIIAQGDGICFAQLPPGALGPGGPEVEGESGIQAPPVTPPGIYPPGTNFN